MQEKKKKDLCSSSALLDIVEDVIFKNNKVTKKKKNKKEILTAPKLDVQMECSRLSSGLTGLQPGVRGHRSWIFEKATLCGYGGASDGENEFDPVNAVTVHS